ncbi:hypothetical protein ES703_26853 [subsurface metagenome]
MNIFIWGSVLLNDSMSLEVENKGLFKNIFIWGSVLLNDSILS